jgi:hypothetical protein
MPFAAVRALQLGLSAVPRVDPRMHRSLTHITAPAAAAAAAAAAAICPAVMCALSCSARTAAGPVCGAEH